MIDILIILNLINLNLRYHIIEKIQSVFYTMKKNVSHSSILEKSVISQKIDLKSYLVNILNKKTTYYIPNVKKMEWNLDNNLKNKNLDKMKELIIKVLSALLATLNNKNS